MSIATYSELKTAIATWLHRSDLDSAIPDFIALAESNIRQDVRCRAMEAAATGTLSATTLALPARFAEARRVLIDNVPQRYLTPTQFTYVRTNTEDARYTIVGETMHFQKSSGDYQVDYWQWFAALADAADTNWLLTNHPGIYLFGSLVEAAAYTKANPEPWAAKYMTAIAKLNRAEQKFGGPLTVRVSAVV